MTPFQEKVRRAIQGIPKGEVRTYKEVAKAVGHPKAYRAVASVVSHNYDTKIPCHRVIRSDGTIGEYNRGGPEQKIKILKSEGYKFKK